MRLIFLFIGLSVISPLSADASFSYSTAAKDNLEYQIDCLAQFIRCTETNMTLYADASDQPWLDRWHQLRLKATSATESGSVVTANLLPALPTAASLSRVSSRINTSSNQTKLANAATRQQILDRFSARFAKRWHAQNATHLARLKLGLISIERDPAIRTLLTKIALLFDNAGTGELPPVVLVATKTHAAGSLATLDQSHIFVESPVNESAANRFPVIVHESIHWRQSQMSHEQQTLLVNAFLASESDCALAAYHLFDEVVATSIGNGVIEQALNSKTDYDRYLGLPYSFYDDHNIDSLSKQLSPVIGQYIRADRRLDTDFVIAYLAIAEKVLNTQCDEISMEMGMAALLLGSPRLRPIRRIAQHHWKSTTLFTDILDTSKNATVHRYPGLSGAIVATREQLERSLRRAEDPRYEQIKRQLATKHTRFVYAERREHHARLYWVVADSEADVAVTFMQFLENRPLRFDGLWIPPDTL